MIDAARPTHTGLCDDDGGPEDAASEVESKGSEHPGLRINGERPRWVESSTERAKTSVFGAPQRVKTRKTSKRHEKT